jgi:gluconate 2-dehydrogenase gamma chain
LEEFMGDTDERPHTTRAGLWSRREMLTRSTTMGVVITIPAVGTATVESALAAAAPKAAAALSPGQSAILKAIVGRLVPADALGPSGTDAGAAAYIEKSLGGGLAGGLKNLAPFYNAALSAVDAYSNSAYGAPFTDLPPDKQDAVLSDIETDKATGFTPSSSAFFAAVHEHTLQGMFGDPIYGGNKKFAGWDLIGYPGVKMPVSAHDQKLGVTVKRAHKSTYADGQFPKAKKEAQA